MLQREIPFLRICVPLCAGIASGLYYEPGIIFFGLSAIPVIILFFTSSRFNKYSENNLFWLPFSLSLYLLGLALYNNEKNSLSTLQTKPSTFLCTLTDYPEEKPKTLLLNVRLHKVIDDKGSHRVKGSMLLYHHKDSIISFTPGDKLLIRCTPIPITNRGNPYEFDYSFFMENLGIKYYAFSQSGSILSVSMEPQRNLRHKALIVREKLIRMYEARGISEENLPLVAALILGEKSRLGQDQKENFIKAGVMHIMAVSGLHAMILSIFIMNLLFFLKKRFNLLRIILTLLFLWSFAFVTGLTPSVLRATIMFSFIQAGGLMHRKVNGINSVLASAFVLILFRPSVIFDAGFLLSYSAVIFIIAFYRDVYLMIHPPNKVLDWVWQSVAITIIAQLGTLPLTILLFNRFPVWFILTNTVIVPLSSLGIILGCLVPVLYPLRFISFGTGFLLDRLTWLLDFLTEKAASLPFSGITGIGMTISESILLFMLIIAFMFSVNGRSRQAVILTLSLLLLHTGVSAADMIRTKKTNELIVYNSLSGRTIGIRTGKILNLYADTLVADPAVLRHCAVKGLHLIYRPLNKSSCLVRAGKTEILICNPTIKEWPVNFNPDIFILSDFDKSERLNIDYSRKNVIVTTGSVAFGDNLSETNIHFIRKSGAYIRRL